MKQQFSEKTHISFIFLLKLVLTEINFTIMMRGLSKSVPDRRSYRDYESCVAQSHVACIGTEKEFVVTGREDCGHGFDIRCDISQIE